MIDGATILRWIHRLPQKGAGVRVLLVTRPDGGRLVQSYDLSQQPPSLFAFADEILHRCRKEKLSSPASLVAMNGCFPESTPLALFEGAPPTATAAASASALFRQANSQMDALESETLFLREKLKFSEQIGDNLRRKLKKQKEKIAVLRKKVTARKKKR